MNDAGRIGFVIRGDYSNTATYDFLDVVFYGNSSYVAKKLTIGHAPTDNNEYWQALAKTPASAVTGVKGNAETTFRVGDVNITPANIGLNNAGSATHPIYFQGGLPKACTYTLEKSVPSDAQFTDTKVTETIIFSGSKTVSSSSSAKITITTDNTEYDLIGIRTSIGYFLTKSNGGVGFNITNMTSASTYLQIDTMRVTPSVSGGVLKTLNFVNPYEYTLDNSGMSEISSQITIYEIIGYKFN